MYTSNMQYIVQACYASHDYMLLFTSRALEYFRHIFSSLCLLCYICVNNIYLFGVLGRFQHCTGHITMGSWKGRGNQYIQLVRVLYCKLPTNGKQLPAFPLEAVPGTEPWPQRWEARVLPLCHRGPRVYNTKTVPGNIMIHHLWVSSQLTSNARVKTDT